jgi:hypothetical protein
VSVHQTIHCQILENQVENLLSAKSIGLGQSAGAWMGSAGPSPVKLYSGAKVFWLHQRKG